MLGLGCLNRGSWSWIGIRVSGFGFGDLGLAIWSVTLLLSLAASSVTSFRVNLIGQLLYLQVTAIGSVTSF
jgi:hypothetical protein